MKGRTEHERKGKGNERKGKVGKMAIPVEQAISALFTFSLKVSFSLLVFFFLPFLSASFSLSLSVCLVPSSAFGFLFLAYLQ